MKCQTIEKKLSAYQDGELSVLEKEQVERHLAGCHSCLEQHVRLKQTWHILGDLTEIRPTPGFYKRVSHKIGLTPEKGLLGSCWRNWGWGALPSPVFASVILAIGMLCGAYIGNSFIKTQPFHNVAAYPEEGFLSSLKVFDPVPPGSLADNYERLLSYNEGHIR
ncbi:MAG: zf-HC2 domain-containing protein [Deltaproteobacteria bacterium]|nr:zf-HC2 domain-containing protein [Deltaproteobacteria bacterium]